MTTLSNYGPQITEAIVSNPSYQAICDFNVSIFPEDGYKRYYPSLQSGRAILQTSDQLVTYLASYGDMHRAKLNSAFNKLFLTENLDGKSVEVIDWGCGQALASGVLIDYIKNNNIDLHLSQFTLIEPSNVALRRGQEHIKAIYQRQPPAKIFLFEGKADQSLLLSSTTSIEKIKLHLFSNILDIETVLLERICLNIFNNFKGVNYFVCVSPVNSGRLKRFYDQFADNVLISQRNLPISTIVFRPSCMKRLKKVICRTEYIFRTNL